MDGLKTFWMSWWDPDPGNWTLYWPWWITGWRDSGSGSFDERSVCAAVRAYDEHAAREVVYASFDRRPDNIDWRFIDEVTKPDWSPYSDRFPQAVWMCWPEAAPPLW